MSNFSLSHFISEENFESHVQETVIDYIEHMKEMDLIKFNSNIVDPIKLLFDKNVYDYSFEEVISKEIQRQQDKSNSNSIGYFHQNMFRYIKNCTVPKEGWDIIFHEEATNFKYYVEMKNKHNTMNSSSSARTYMKMQNKQMKNSRKEDPENIICALVEVISKKSRNDCWEVVVSKEPFKDEFIRRISIDRFYALVTGDDEAFYKICNQLPRTIEKIVSNQKTTISEVNHTVYKQLIEKNPDVLKSLYLLAFSDYMGF